MHIFNRRLLNRLKSYQGQNQTKIISTFLFLHSTEASSREQKASPGNGQDFNCSYDLYARQIVCL